MKNVHKRISPKHSADVFAASHPIPPQDFSGRGRFDQSRIKVAMLMDGDA